MASPKKTSDGGHIIDVKRPGNSAPSSTSKPVIVTNRPILKDPMVVSGDEDGESKPTENLMRKTAPALKPVGLPVPDAAKPEPGGSEPTEPEAPATTETPPVPETSAVSDDTTKPEEKPVEAADEETKPAPADEPAAKEVPASDPAKAEPAPGEAEAQNAEADKPADGKDAGTANPEAVAQAEADKKAAHDQEIQKLVDAKQYFLPINSVEKRKSRHFIALGVLLSLLLAAAWVDVALDAGLVSIPGVKPVTHFFSN